MTTKSNTRDSIPALKSRVQELEAQVADLKKRLDDLRKAKNTTILKREREVLEVGTPFGKRATSDPRVSVLGRSLAEVKLSHAEEIRDLNRRLDQGKNTPRTEAKTTDCGHLALIESLGSENLALNVDNEELRERVEGLYRELSIKEAQWCESEEKYKLKLQQSWGEKYAEWMVATERELEGLRHANETLRQTLHTKNPDLSREGPAT